MNKMAVVKWYDSDTPDTVKLAAQAYGIQIKCTAPTGDMNETYVCVFGPTDSVNRFIEDVAEDSIEPFESKRELSDDEYQEWLSDALQPFGCLYIPKYGDKDED